MCTYVFFNNSKQLRWVIDFVFKQAQDESMAKVSNREKILCEGMKVVHARGFANASVRDIVGAAGVPQGSFTNHFSSKEAFGLEIIDRYALGAEAIFDKTLRNESLSPL